MLDESRSFFCSMHQCTVYYSYVEQVVGMIVLGNCLDFLRYPFHPVLDAYSHTNQVRNDVSMTFHVLFAQYVSNKSSSSATRTNLRASVLLLTLFRCWLDNFKSGRTEYDFFWTCYQHLNNVLLDPDGLKHSSIKIKISRVWTKHASWLFLPFFNPETLVDEFQISHYSDD